MPGRGTRHHSIRVPDELWKAAQARAKRRGETLTQVMRQALERYVSETDDGES